MPSVNQPITTMSLGAGTKRAIRALLQAYLEVFSVSSPARLRVRLMPVVGVGSDGELVRLRLRISASAATRYNNAVNTRNTIRVAKGYPALLSKPPRALLAELEADLAQLPPEELGLAMAIAPELTRASAYLAHRTEVALGAPLNPGQLDSMLDALPPCHPFPAGLPPAALAL